jgi:uncharacterized protein (DUF1501 family)
MANWHDRRKSESQNSQFNRTAQRRAFHRETELPKLIGLWPAELRDYSIEGTARIVALLSKALRSERRRASAGHWAYDLTRHMALAAALKEEEARLAGLKRAEQSASGGGKKTMRPAALKSEVRLAGGLAQLRAGAEFIGDADRQRDVVA